jgi:apolipoprotein N-acyltransferase
LSGLRRAGLVALSAALFAAAFPPLGFYPLAWVALVPLLSALVRSGPLAGFGSGLLWSLLVGMLTSSWLPRMIAEYFEVGAGWAWSAAGLATLGTGIFYGLFGAWIGALARARTPSPLAVALLFGACEYGRTVSFVANPWMLSGYSQAPFALLRQAADVGGVVGLGMLLAAANASAAAVVDARWRTARPARAALATLAVLALTLAYGQWRLATSFAEGDAVSVVLVQSAIASERRFEPRFRRENLAHQLDLVARAGNLAPDLILLSELAVDVPFEAGSRERRALGQIAERSGAELLVGAPLVQNPLVTPGLLNSFFLLRGRELADRYDKVALAPFSETNPLRGYLDVGLEAYVAGHTRRPIATRAGGMGILLCSEVMFGAFTRESVRLGAAFLANPANDSWFGSEAAARAQLDVARLRAVESRRWMVRPTFTGITAVIDAHGRVTAEAAAGVPKLLEGTIHRSTATTLYGRWGDAVARAGMVGAVLWSAWAGGQALRARRRSA